MPAYVNFALVREVFIMTGYQKASVEDVLNQLMEENRKLTERVENLEERFDATITLVETLINLKKMRLDNVDEVRIPDGYKCKGWIFYSNEDDCNCLYKIREDGTCNTKLTDYSVDSCYMMWSYDSGYIIVGLKRPRNGRTTEKFPV